MKRKSLFRTFTFIVLASIITIVAGCGSKASPANGSAAGSGSAPAAAAASDSKKYEGVVVNIEGSQIGPILIAKEKGWFEEEFAKYGATVKYQSLQSASQFLEAIASDRLDFARTGYIGTITGQAANIGFTSISEGSNGGGDGIIVPKDSPVQSVKDLKGKKIAVSKGSSSWGLLLNALKKDGLKLADIQAINLQPDEAQSAFQSGKVDAWVVWEPFRTNQIKNQGAKLLAEGKTIGAFNPAYNIVRTKFAKQYPELVGAYLKAYERALQWQNKNLDEAVTLLAKSKKLDEETIRISLTNNVATNLPISAEANKSQQATADLMLESGDLKEKLDVTKVIDNSYIEKALKEYPTEKR